jgi:hypothetical protein
MTASNRQQRFKGIDYLSQLQASCDLILQLGGEDVAPLTMREFNEGRRAVTGNLPEARTVCRNLRLSWEELKETAILDDRVKSYRIRTGVGTHGSGLTADEIRVALRTVAGRLGFDALSRSDYDVEQAKDARRRRAAGRPRTASAIAAHPLPPSSQIQASAGGWNEALEIAELRPKQVHRQKSLTWEEALTRCLIETGAFPAQKRLRRYVTQRRLALVRPHGSYDDQVASVRDRFRAEGRWAPARAIDIRSDPWADGLFEPDPEVLAVLDEDLIALGQPLGPPGIKHGYTREDCLEAVRTATGLLKPGEVLTQSAYNRLRKTHPELPAYNVLRRHGGGLKTLRDEVASR